MPPPHTQLQHKLRTEYAVTLGCDIHLRVLDLCRWESERAQNVSIAHNTAQLSKHLASATQPNCRPLVMNFFIPSCPGCKRMFPKFMQIAKDNPHIDFVKVRPGYTLTASKPV